MTTTPEENKAIMQRLHAAFDAYDLDACEQVLAPDVKTYAGGMPGPMDRAAFRAMGQSFLDAFSESRHSYQSILAEGDQVAAFIVWTAVHTGAFNGVPATGKKVQMEVLVLDRIRGGRIVEHRANMDVMGLLAQIGAMPAAA